MELPPRYYSKYKPICRLSDPDHPHKLCRRRRRSHPPVSMCFSCNGELMKDSEYYYYCATCNLKFHRGCHITLPKIRHPCHPSHLLNLISIDPDFDGSSTSEEEKHEVDDDNKDDDDDDDDDDYADSYDDADSFGFSEDSHDDDDDGDDFDYDVDASLSHSKCKCCQKRLENVYYHCSICKFNLNKSCAKRPPPPTTISHLKSHEHTHTLFPIRLPLPCDACGLSLSDPKDFVYACLPCSRMVHRSCIYLPRVIQITRHPHRLSFTSSLQPGDFLCGVCRKTVHVNYGQYSCNKGCHYAVHSKCATREDVWDEIDLEGVPEETEEDLEPFVRIDEETIQHFSHQHYLRLHVKKTICEEDKFCEACTLPIMISQRFYSCVQCDFVLDEACASLPPKKYHPLHKHPLTLYSSIGSISNVSGGFLSVTLKDIFRCDGCHRKCCGFVYKCRQCNFWLDTRCASLPDPLIHGCHPHDLFFNLTKGNCMGCGSDHCSSYFLECIKCDSFLGITCATLPSKAHYKHDRHRLTLCYGEQEDTTSGQYWCEICESKLDPRTWFYTCDSCLITLHLNCLLSQGIYLKPHHIFKIDREPYGEVEIARNDGNSRLFCSECHIRCAQTLVFKRIQIYGNYCTIECVAKFFAQPRIADIPPKCPETSCTLF